MREIEILGVWNKELVYLFIILWLFVSFYGNTVGCIKVAGYFNLLYIACGLPPK